MDRNWFEEASNMQIFHLGVILQVPAVNIWFAVRFLSCSNLITSSQVKHQTGESHGQSAQLPDAHVWQEHQLSSLQDAAEVNITLTSV